MAEEILDNTLPNPAETTVVDPPVVKPDPTYDQAMQALKAKTASHTAFYGTGTLAPKFVDYSQTKKYLDEAYGYSPNRDNEDFYAQKQGIGGDLLDIGAAATLKLPSLIVTKVAGGLGFIGGLMNPTNWTSEDGYIASASDNALSRWSESAEETVKNEWLPTFQEASDVNKGFFRRALTDLDFWTSDVVDGAAFMASAFVPGMALSKIGAGAKLASALSSLRLGVNTAGEVVNGLETAQKYLSSAQKFAKSFDAATTWALATASESMYEANDVRKNVLNSLDGKINPNTGSEYTEQEKKEIAGGAARNTFLLNTTLLGATNAIQMKYMYKALGIAESQVGKIALNATEDGFERVAAKTKWGKFLDSKYGALGKGLAIGTISEGYVEENVQLAIQRMNQEFGAAGKIAGINDYFDVVTRAGKQIKDATLGNDQEASLSIGLGALLGGVIGGAGDVKQMKKDRLTTDTAIANLNQSRNSWLKFGNLYETTEEDVLGSDGKPTGEKTSKLKLDEDNNPIVNETKLADIVSDFSSNLTMLDLADKLKDKNQAKFLRDLSFRNYVHAHISAGIEDSLLQKLDDAQNATPEALAKMGFDPNSKQDVQSYKALAGKIIAQDALIKKSILRTGNEQEENARANTLTNLADQQSILQGISRDLALDADKIKADLVNPEISSLSDISVDGANALQYRIDSQKAYIEQLTQIKASSIKLKVAEQLLNELSKEKAQFLINNTMALESIKSQDNGYYNYEKESRTTSPLNSAYQQNLIEKAQYDNSARSMGLEFAQYADTKNGLKNFKSNIEQEVVNPINQRMQEDEVKENLGIDDPQLDPNDPRIKEYEDKRDKSISELEDLYEETNTHAVTIDKDGIKVYTLSNGIITAFEDVVPDQIPEKLYNELKDINDRLKKINQDFDGDINSLTQPQGTENLNSEVVPTENNLADFYVFDGQNIKEGLIFEEENGDKWVVISSQPFKTGNVEKIKLGLLDKDGKRTGRSTNVDSLKGFTLSDFETKTTTTDEKGNTVEATKITSVIKPKESIPNDPNKFKIIRENEIIRIYPYQQTISGKRESKPAAQARLDKLLKDTPKEVLVGGTTMTISKSEKGKPTEFAGAPSGNPNGNLEVNPEYLTVQVEYNGQPIGFVTNYTLYSVRDKDGKNVPIEKLTVKQFSEIFDITNKDPKIALETFKQNFIRGRKLFNTLSSLLGNSNSISISNEQLNQMIGLNVSIGQFDTINEQAGEVGANLDELDYNTINGHTYVINRVRKYNKGSFTYNSVPVTSATGSERRQIEKEIKEAQAQGRDLTENLGRYIAVVKLPNGNIRFVSLTTDKWNEVQLSDLVSKINERSRLSKDNNLTDKEKETGFELGVSGMATATKAKYVGGKDETYNDKLNDEIVDTLFIALPKKQNIGTYVDFYVNAMGNLQLKFNVLVGPKRTIKHSIVVRDNDNTKPLDFKNIDDLISRANKAIVDYNKGAKTPEQMVNITLSKENFKQAIPDTIGETEAKGMRTMVKPGVVKDITLTYTPKDSIESVIPAKTEPTPQIEYISKKEYNSLPKVEVDPVKQAELAKIGNQGIISDPQARAQLDEMMGININPEIIIFEPLTGTVDGSWDKASPINNKLEDRFFSTLKENDKIVTGNNETLFYKNGKIIKSDGSDYGFTNIPVTAILARGATIYREDKIIQVDPLKTTQVSTKSFKQQSDEIKAEQFEYIKTKTAELIASGVKPGMATIKARQEANVIYNARLDDLKLKLGANNRALKVLSREAFNEQSIVNINKFKQWVKNNLPEGIISVQEINDLTSNLSKNNITVGMFTSYVETLQNGNTSIKGRIRVGDQTPYKYHEAFHAVFRLLLNNKQIDQLLDIAKREVKADLKKQDISMTNALSDFKALHPLYNNLTSRQLEDTYYEEYLADRFDDWKTDKKVDTSHVSKSFFAKILDWIKALFTGRSASEIEALFQDIESGKYKNSNVQSNYFTQEQANMMTEPALKVIKVGTEIVQDENGNDVEIDRYLSQQEGDQLASSITSLFYERLGQSETYNKKEILDSIMDDYKNLYDSAREDNYYAEELDRLFPDESQEDLRIEYLQRLEDKYNVFADEENREILSQAVDVHLRMMGLKQQLDSDQFDDAVDEYGDRVTTDNWKETHSIGGFGSLSQFLRQYIATTTYEYIDEFGNEHLKDGVPLLQAVNANLVYNGMLKSVANLSDENVVMSRLRLLKSQDTETGKFITKFFNDAGIDFNEDGTWFTTKPERAQLIQQVIKGFNQYSVDYVFLNKDVSEKAQITHMMLANRKDSARTQFSIWQNAYIRLFEDEVLKIRDNSKKSEFYSERIEPLQDMYTLMDTSKSISDERVDLESKDITNLLKNNLGISLDYNFVKYSILANKDRTLLTQAQQNMLDAYTDIYFITRDDVLQIIRSVQSGENPFAKNIDTENSEEYTSDEERMDSTALPKDSQSEKEIGDLGKGGVITRINNIAKGNAIFDETVYSTSWKNASGELVYGHQLPTYHLVAVQDLNNPLKIQELNEDPFLITNHLLNSSEFEVLQGQLRVTRVDGVKSSFLTETEDGFREDKTNTINKNKGITYGSFSDREFLISLFDLYAYGKEYKSENGSFRTSQHLIRVLEASNTGDTIGLPVIKAVSLTKSNKTVLTEEAINILYNEIEREFDRIRRVQDEINSIQTQQNEPVDEIDGYHYGTNKDTGKRDYSKGRGLQFYKTGLMLGNVKSELETLALDPNFNLSSRKGEIKERIDNYWQEQIAGLMETMSSESVHVITKDEVNLNAGEEQTYSNRLMDKFIEKGFTKKDSDNTADDRKNSLLNIIPNKMEHNIGQVLINDYINTLSFNQLLLGDQAESLKDSVDEVKRAKGANGSGSSLRSLITAPQLGINSPFVESHILQFEDPLYKSQYSGGNKEKADAQMWGTAKSMRYVLHGLGKLNPFVAKMLDKIENGISLTSQEVFGYVDKSGVKQDGLKGLNEMFNSKKLVYYDGKMYIKTSFVMLTKELTSWNNNGTWKSLPGKEALHDMREKLEDFERRNNTVTFSVPKSASKGLKKNIAGSIQEANDNNFQPQDTKFWRLQLENPSNKLIITDPTQAKQLILAEQDENLKVDFMGSPTTIGQLKKAYLSNTAQRIKNNYQSARNDIFNIEGAYKELSSSIDLGKVTPKLANFQKKAVDQLRSTGADAQTIDFFDLDKSGNPKYNLNNPITLDKYTQLFLAYFSKGVMSEKVPGHSVALMSNYGYKMVKKVTSLDNTGQPKSWDIVRTDQVKKSPELYSSAKNWNNDLDREFEGLKIGDYYIDDLRHNVPEYNSKGEIIGRFSEFVMPAHYRELMNLTSDDELPDNIMKSFGVRIPSQDKHSTISLKMVDFMPAFYGSTAIFPHELIEISGADFDIDKLYMHIANTYSKNGKLIPYGTATTQEEKFEEFIEYTRANNKSFKTAFKELKESTDNTTIDDELDTDEALSIFSDALSLESIDDNMFLYKEALKMVGLPSSDTEYAKYVKENGELNNGVLNNQILAAKLALINNEHMTTAKEGSIPIAFEVASVDPLKQEVNDLIKDFANPESETYVPELADIVVEGSTDTDSIIGKYKSFKNNKEGARNIGPAVNSILTYSTMASFNINLRNRYLKTVNQSVDSDAKTTYDPVWEDLFLFKLNGHTFNTYSPVNKSGQQSLRAYDPITKDYTGERIFGAISTVVSAMTDNAKERLAARLGLNIEAIGYLSNMLAQGVPMKSAIRFLLQPAIRKYFSLTKIASNNIKTGKELNIRKGDILDDLLTEYRVEDYQEIELTDELLNEGLATNGSDNDIQYAMLLSFKGIVSQAKSFSKVAQVLKLTKGLGTSFENIDKINNNIADLGLRLDDNDFIRSIVPFDLRQAFMGKDTSKPYHEFIYNYIQTSDQINHLSQSMFIEKTPVFQRISDIVKDNLYIRRGNAEDFNIKLKRDLISYLSIKAYMKSLDTKGSFRTLQSLDNAMIYDESAKDKPETFNDIIDTFRIIRAKLPNNYFANKFVNIISTQRTDNENNSVMNDLNRDGINKAEANTWAKLSEYQIEKIRDSFIEIYQNDDTRENAVDIFNYLLVKDAGQFKSNSFIRMIPTFMFDGLLRSTAKVNDILKLSINPKDISTDVNKRYVDLFGVNAIGIFNEFMKSYTSHIGNSYEIKKVLNKKPVYSTKFGEGVNVDKVKAYEPQSFQITIEETKDGVTKPSEILIDIFKGIRTGEREMFDTGTNQGIIQISPIKGKFDPTEKAMYAKNAALLRSKDFARYTDGSYDFPYVLVDDSTNKRKYYKLVSVITQVKDEKGKSTRITLEDQDQENANILIKPNQTVANGIGAKYIEYQPTGSRKSTMIGELFGSIPVIPKTPRARKQFGNNNAFGLEAGRYAGMSASDIENRMGLENKPVIVSNTRTQDINDPVVTLENMGVKVKTSNTGFTFSGAIWDLIPIEKRNTIKTPNDLLSLLGIDTISEGYKAQELEPSSDMYDDIPLPGTDIQSSVSTMNDEESVISSFTEESSVELMKKSSGMLFNPEMASKFANLLKKTNSKSNPLNDDCA